MVKMYRDIGEMLGLEESTSEEDSKRELSAFERFNIGLYWGAIGGLQRNADNLSRLFPSVFRLNDKTPPKDRMIEAARNVPDYSLNGHTGLSASGAGYLLGNFASHPVTLVSAAATATYCFSR